MDIRSVRFEAFKSLYNVACEFEHLTVITGPNGAGKSNFVEALNFIGDVYASGLEVAVSKAGGFDNIAHRRSRRGKKSIRFSIEVNITPRDLMRIQSFGINEINQKNLSELNLTYRHTFSLNAAGPSLRANYKVDYEVLELLDAKGRNLLRRERIGDKFSTRSTNLNSKLGVTYKALIYPYADKDFIRIIKSRSLSETSLIPEQDRFNNLLSQIWKTLGSIRVFQLSPHQLRTPGVPSPNAFLERHGDNLPGAAHYLSRNDKSAWRNVQRSMRSILPNLAEIEIVHTEDRRLALRFRENNVGRAWSTGEVSDGTIQALALFLGLFDKRNPMLAIEEPENAIHPWILREFINSCNNAGGKQIIMTTHSPVLLNFVSPKILRLMFMRNGRSQILPFLELDPVVSQLALSGELSPFEVYDSGALPEAIPPGLSSTAEVIDDVDTL